VLISHQLQRGGYRRVCLTPGQISLSVSNILPVLQMHAVDARMVPTDEAQWIGAVGRDIPPEVQITRVCRRLRHRSIP
jgi:hypothetical protein